MASNPPFAVVSKAPAVVGKSAELEEPSTYALPPPSTWTCSPLSTAEPPRKVEYTSAEPVGFSFVTKTSFWPRRVRWNDPALVGKSLDRVSPVT